MNLASQSVLEGLNACFDHRSEIYIPELGRTFRVNRLACRFFAAQNPSWQGGNRKGLPKSFLNRFVKVYVNALGAEDFSPILKCLFPKIESHMLEKMVVFNSKIDKAVNIEQTIGMIGRPFEFNLRDLMRWAQLVISCKSENPAQFTSMIYSDRMRSTDDRSAIEAIAREVFGHVPPVLYNIWFTNDYICVADGALKRYANPTYCPPGLILPSQVPVLRSMIHCVNMNWLVILIGEAGSGKTAMINILAAMAGKRLHSLYLTSDSDANDLIGSYEQVSHEHELSRVKEKMVDLVQKMPACSIERKHIEAAPSVESLRGIFSEMQITYKDNEQMCNSTDVIAEILDRLKLQESASKRLRFQWMNSVVVDAVRSGDWVVLENVHFCSAAVLDRLNGLLEKNGILTVTEAGSVNGNIPSYLPHPEFRIFFTLNPNLGSISRAMRNRGVEITVTKETDWFHTENEMNLREVLNCHAIFNVPSTDRTFSSAHEFLSNARKVHCLSLIEENESTAISSNFDADLVSSLKNCSVANKNRLLRLLHDLTEGNATSNEVLAVVKLIFMLSSPLSLREVATRMQTVDIFDNSEATFERMLQFQQSTDIPWDSRWYPALKILMAKESDAVENTSCLAFVFIVLNNVLVRMKSVDQSPLEWCRRFLEGKIRKDKVPVAAFCWFRELVAAIRNFSSVYIDTLTHEIDGDCLSHFIIGYAAVKLLIDFIHRPFDSDATFEFILIWRSFTRNFIDPLAFYFSKSHLADGILKAVEFAQVELEFDPEKYKKYRCGVVTFRFPGLIDLENLEQNVVRRKSMKKLDFAVEANVANLSSPTFRQKIHEFRNFFYSIEDQKPNESSTEELMKIVASHENPDGSYHHVCGFVDSFQYITTVAAIATIDKNSTQLREYCVKSILMPMQTMSLIDRIDSFELIQMLRKFKCLNAMAPKFIRPNEADEVNVSLVF